MQDIAAFGGFPLTIGLWALKWLVIWGLSAVEGDAGATWSVIYEHTPEKMNRFLATKTVVKVVIVKQRGSLDEARLEQTPYPFYTQLIWRYLGIK